jgi:cell wall-associated NlpC family hydrolase
MPQDPVGDRAADAAQDFVGTPVVWGQSTHGQGVDFKGMVRGVAQAIGRPEASSFYGNFRAYRPDRKVPTGLLKEGLAALFDPVDQASDRLRNGDVLLLRFKGKAQHLAIVTCDGERAVHADGPSGKVRERRLAAMLQLYGLDSAWRWRELEGER